MGECAFFIVVYYESIKRELNKRLIFDSRCDARLKAKAEGCTRLAYTKIVETLSYYFFFKNNTLIFLLPKS